MKCSYCSLLWASLFELRSNALRNQTSLYLKSAQIPHHSTSGSVAPPNFPAFACEERSFPLFTNEFSNNLIQQVAQRTGVKAIMRVGGSSLDDGFYNQSQQQALIVPGNQECINVPVNVTIGPSFFDYFSKLNVSYIVNIPLRRDNLTDSVQFATDAYNTIGAANINQLEVGNEPSSRDYNLTKQEYVARWGEFTTNISQSLGLSLDDPIYMALSLAVNNNWTIPAVFQRGPDKGGLIKYVQRIQSVAIHYYQVWRNITTESLQRNLMNHTAVSRRIDNKLLGLDYCKSLGLPLSWGETGSSLNGYLDDNHNRTYNNYGFEAVLGSALWSLDFMLYSISVGFHRNNYQLGFDFGYALWLPEYSNCSGRPAEVAVPYYGHIVTADIIGNSGPVRIKNIDLFLDLLSAYAVYDATSYGLKKVAFLNLELWNTTLGYERPSFQLTIDVPYGTTQVTVVYLNSPEGANAIDPANVTWNGYSWLKANNGIGMPSTNIQNDTEIMTPNKGSVSFSLDASSAAVLYLN